jgi:hypothetical protein
MVVVRRSRRALPSLYLLDSELSGCLRPLSTLASSRSLPGNFTANPTKGGTRSPVCVRNAQAGKDSPTLITPLCLPVRRTCLPLRGDRQAQTGSGASGPKSSGGSRQVFPDQCFEYVQFLCVLRAPTARPLVPAVELHCSGSGKQRPGTLQMVQDPVPKAQRSRSDAARSRSCVASRGMPAPS